MAKQIMIDKCTFHSACDRPEATVNVESSCDLLTVATVTSQKADRI